MKIAVYDHVNKERLLWELSVVGKITGEYLRVPLVERLPYYYYEVGSSAPSMTTKVIEFKVDVRVNSETTHPNDITKITTTIHTKVLLTKEPLENLMKLNNFRVSGETPEKEYERPRSLFA